MWINGYNVNVKEIKDFKEELNKLEEEIEQQRQTYSKLLKQGKRKLANIILCKLHNNEEVLKDSLKAGQLFYEDYLKEF